MTSLDSLPLSSPLPSSSSDRERCTPVLETSRLVLNAPRLEDVRALVDVLDDRRIAEMTANIPHPYRQADAEAWIAGAWKGPDKPFLIRNRVTGALVGGVGFTASENNLPEIGYWIAPAAWGRGYATEAAHALVDHLFADEGVATITARVRVVNPASRRVLEKCGFQWIGVGLSRSRLLNSSVPVDKFHLERGVWASLRSWARAEETCA